MSLAFLLIVLVATFSGTTRSQTSSNAQTLSQSPRWEYKVVDGSLGVSDGKLNKYGQDGWELIGADFDVVNGRSSARRYLFKRQR